MSPGLELVAVADVEHERRVLALEASRQALGVDHLEALHRALLRAPGGHSAVEEAAHAEPDRGEQLRRLELVAVGGGDDDQLGAAGDDPAHLGAETGVIGGGADRAGDVRLVELLVGARVDHHRPAGDRRLDRTRGERRRRTELLDQRTPVEGDDVLDVGGPVGERRHRVLDELLLAGEAQRSVVRGARSRSWSSTCGRSRHFRRASRRGARARPRPRRGGRAGARAGSGRSRRRPRGARSPGRAGRRPRRRASPRSGPPMDRRRAPRPAGGRRCARGGAPACASPSPRPRPAPASSRRRRARAHSPPRPAHGCGSSPRSRRRAARDRRRDQRGCGSRARARCHAVQPAEPQVGVDVPLGIDHRGDPGGDAADQIGRAAEILMDDLAEEHAQAWDSIACLQA